MGYKNLTILNIKIFKKLIMGSGIDVKLFYDYTKRIL